MRPTLPLNIQLLHSTTALITDNRIPVGEDHPASCIIVTECLPELKRPKRGAEHPPSSSAGLRMDRAIPHLPSVPAYACHVVTFTVTSIS